MVPRIVRFRGVLLGLAVCEPGAAPAALCLAESLIARGGFDARDQMERYALCGLEGMDAASGTALRRFAATGDPFSGSTDPRMAGNGSLTRLAPVALWFARDEVQAVHEAARSSRTTHGAPVCVDACRYFAALLCGALRGCSKEELLAPEFWRHGRLVSSIDAIRQGAFLRHESRVSGNVADSLDAALWAFGRSTDFEAGVSLLGKPDAIYGQIAGAYYGEESIPSRWRAVLHRAEEIGRMAEQLEASKSPGTVAGPAS